MTTKREEFIKMVQSVIDYIEVETHAPNEPIYYSKEALDYFEEFKNESSNSKVVELTENGTKVLKFMQENYEKYNNSFKAKEIGEGLFISSRSVSGSMRKLVSEGFVEKMGGEPTSYAITEKGKLRELT